jgi:hypothetical protein
MWSSADAIKLDWIYHNFVALCLKASFKSIAVNYAIPLEQLKSNTLGKRRYHSDELPFTQIHRSFKFCPSILETLSLRVPSPYSIDFSMCKVCTSSKNCSSPR